VETLTRSPEDSPAFTIAPDRDWLATVRQILPTSRRVLGSLRPTWQLPGVFAIDPPFLRTAGIRALVWDVDGTLTHRHAPELAAEVRAPLERLLAADGLKHVLLSNSNEARFAQLCDLFDGVPVVKGYVSAAGPVFRVRQGSDERWSRPARGVLRPIRKPDPLLARFALQVLEVPDPTAVALVGDQYLTDVATANLAGIRSIKVPTLGRASFPLPVRVLQKVDEWLYRLTV
jgi:predicted HAD superfamily phosphohydrolase YqeG